MSHLNRILIQLETSGESWAGTDNHLYLGVVGTGGGREFALAVPNFDVLKKEIVSNTGSIRLIL